MERKLVSADSHINEPPDLWTSRAPAHLETLIPRVVSIEGLGDAWVTEPAAKPKPVATSAVAGQKPEEYLSKPVTYKQMRPGSFDPVARLADLDIDGVVAEVLYPGIGRALDRFYDAEVRLFCARTYNEWMTGFQDVNRDRLVGLAILPPLDDGDNATIVLREAVALGLRGAFLPVPDGGLPLTHPDAEGFWQAAEALQIPISLHAGASKRTQTRITDAAAVPGWNEAFLSNLKFDVGNYISLLIFGGVLDRHPGLKVVIAEAGIGWMPYLLENMESVYERHRHYMKTALARRPTEVFHKHFYATFQEDLAGIRLRDVLGVGNIMWASDYPHTDTTWPKSREVVDRYFEDVPADQTERIVARNCTELYALPS